jgi:hypothetical protein
LTPRVAVPLRLEQALRDRLANEAKDRDMSMNRLAEIVIERGLATLMPLDAILTKPNARKLNGDA